MDSSESLPRRWPSSGAQVASPQRRAPADAPPGTAASAACGRRRRRLAAWRAGSSLGTACQREGTKATGFLGGKMVGEASTTWDFRGFQRGDTELMYVCTVFAAILLDLMRLVGKFTELWYRWAIYIVRT